MNDSRNCAVIVAVISECEFARLTHIEADTAAISALGLRLRIATMSLVLLAFLGLVGKDYTLLPST